MYYQKKSFSVANYFNFYRVKNSRYFLAILIMRDLSNFVTCIGAKITRIFGNLDVIHRICQNFYRFKNLKIFFENFDVSFVKFANLIGSKIWKHYFCNFDDVSFVKFWNHSKSKLVKNLIISAWKWLKNLKIKMQNLANLTSLLSNFAQIDYPYFRILTCWVFSLIKIFKSISWQHCKWKCYFLKLDVLHEMPKNV